MAKPRLIILIRHAQSEGNKNREIHQAVPDHRVKLTNEGWSQAYDAGRRLRHLLRPDDTLHIYTSPYRRTRETTEGILATLTSDDPEPSPFRRTNIKVYEEPRLREQDFGNFQPCSAEMERMWHERADYGHFFYRIPNGESAADAYDRVSGFNESLWRQFGEDDFASVCILVTHGLMSRVFLMKWYHFTVEYFEDLRNVEHCEFLVMRKQENGKYLLENNLRTWSELRREKAALKDGKDRPDEKPAPPQHARRWGGCPNGCDHSSHYKKRHEPDTTMDSSASSSSPQHTAFPACRRHDKPEPALAMALAAGGDTAAEQLQKQLRPLKSPHMHLGRDFGGTWSGHASAADSGSERGGPESDDETNGVQHARHLSVQSIDGGVVYANRLGDAPASTGGSDLDDVDEAEKQDRSIRGSVY